eukprot:scaffold7379_cov175-Pinguiococcus_pyrenoidosus.AAC.1
MDISPERRGLLLLDGCATHVNLEFVEMCRKAGLDVLLRPPHTTHRLQPEDTSCFSMFKTGVGREKNHHIGKAMMMGRSPRVKFGDWMGIICEPFRTTFTAQNVLRAWAHVGIRPFTRRVFHSLLQEETLAAQAKTRAARTTPM